MITEKSLLERLINAMERTRNEKCMSQEQMAKALGMSSSMYKKTIAGQRSGAGLLYTAHRLGVLAGMSAFELFNLPAETTSGILVMDILKILRNLSVSQLRFIKGICEFESAFQCGLSDQEDLVTVMKITGNMEDGMIYDSSNVYKINAASYRNAFGDDLHCGIEITSNHLSPIYHVGDILLICQKPPRHGDTGIFINKETKRVYIRKFYQDRNICRLEPLSHYGRTIEVNSTDVEEMSKWIKYGYVLTKMRSEGV